MGGRRPGEGMATQPRLQGGVVTRAGKIARGHGDAGGDPGEGHGDEGVGTGGGAGPGSGCGHQLRSTTAVDNEGSDDGGRQWEGGG